MAQPLKYEDPQRYYFLTNRTLGSRLWFVNNPELERLILTYLARYQELYGVELTAFTLQGNHYHLIARFPGRNKSAFLRAFNSIVARLTKERTGKVEGKLWARRTSEQVLGGNAAIEHWGFYCALNATLSGQAEHPRDYPAYNSFSSAVRGKSASFKLFLRSQYRDKKRFARSLRPEDFIVTHTLRFNRLPGYEHLSQSEYESMMRQKFEGRRKEAVQERRAQGKGFASRASLRKIKPGSIPKTTKVSTRYSFRPLILTLCPVLRDEYLAEYFELVTRYRLASERYRAGDDTVQFPPGTFKPPRFVSC